MSLDGFIEVALEKVEPWKHESNINEDNLVNVIAVPELLKRFQRRAAKIHLGSSNLTRGGFREVFHTILILAFCHSMDRKIRHSCKDRRQ